MPRPDPARLRFASSCGVVFDKEGRVLLHRRSDNGLWSLPGGAIETGETAHAAAVREVQEETGYDVAVVRLLGVYSNPEQTTTRYPDGNVRVWVSATFVCVVTGGKPQLRDETLEVGWWSPESMPAGLREDHIQRIRDALSDSDSAFYR